MYKKQRKGKKKWVRVKEKWRKTLLPDSAEIQAGSDKVRAGEASVQHKSKKAVRSSHIGEIIACQFI